jgi:hypothetical protein
MIPRHEHFRQGSLSSKILEPRRIYVTTPTLPITPSPLSDRACRTPQRTNRISEQAVRALAASCPGHARGARGSWRRGVPRTSLVVDARRRVSARLVRLRGVLEIRWPRHFSSLDHVAGKLTYRYAKTTRCHHVTARPMSSKRSARQREIGLRNR